MSNEEKWRGKDDVFEWNQINMSWNEKREKFNSRWKKNSSWMKVFIENKRTKKGLKNRKKFEKRTEKKKKKVKKFEW